VRIDIDLWLAVVLVIGHAGVVITVLGRLLRGMRDQVQDLNTHLNTMKQFNKYLSEQLSTIQGLHDLCFKLQAEAQSYEKENLEKQLANLKKGSENAKTCNSADLLRLMENYLDHLDELRHLSSKPLGVKMISKPYRQV
jgi:hypothetical protein